jgi:hypothetical protein
MFYIMFVDFAIINVTYAITGVSVKPFHQLLLCFQCCALIRIKQLWTTLKDGTYLFRYGKGKEKLVCLSSNLAPRSVTFLSNFGFFMFLPTPQHLLAPSAVIVHFVVELYFADFV